MPTNPQAFLDSLRKQLADAPDGVDVSAIAKAIEALENPDEVRTKIWFLLDRSGSMQSLAGDVIGGFNRFVQEQASKPDKARLTVIQFDGNNPFELIHDGVRIAEVPELTGDIYSPRGATPLYDAVADLIDRADGRIAGRVTNGQPVEDQLVLIFTDGLENASRRNDRSKVFDLIHQRQDADWTFVFMGANQDSYAEGGKIGLATGNVQDYAATPDSVGDAFGSMSRATGDFRGKSRRQRGADKDRFFGDIKEAEEALRRKKNK